MDWSCSSCWFLENISKNFYNSLYLLLYQVVHWFMNLSDPNTQQAGLVSIVVGAGAAWFGLYTGSSKKFKDK